jgi:hypothetical protein
LIPLAVTIADLPVSTFTGLAAPSTQKTTTKMMGQISDLPVPAL